MRDATITDLEEIIAEKIDASSTAQLRAFFTPHAPALFRLLATVAEDDNFKISLTTLAIIGALVVALRGEEGHTQAHAGLGAAAPIVMPSQRDRSIVSRMLGDALEPLIDALVQKMGDSKIVIRRQTHKIFARLMESLGPSVVVQHVFTTSALGHS